MTLHGLRKIGKATFADLVNKKYPIDTPGRFEALPTSAAKARKAAL